MAKPQGQRIENAVVALFELDREFNKRLHDVFGEADECVQEKLNFDGCCDIACDLIGIPQETDMDIQAYVDEHDQEPDDWFSRDWIIDEYMHCETGQDFLKACHEVILEVADKE